MASSAMNFSFFLLLTLLSTLHITNARDSQYFNKVSRTTTTPDVLPTTTEPPNNQPQKESPDFLPDNENTYGLYSHESGQLPPATTLTNEPTTITPQTKIPLNKHLPKNYNPVSYVTEPEGYTESTPTTENPNYSTNPTNYYNGNQEEDSEYRNYPSSTTTPTTGNTNSRFDNNKFYYNGGSSFNSQPQGFADTRLNGGSTFTNGGDTNGFRPQGMSDTRYMENGKYFYDVNNERYSDNHPYVSLRGARVRNDYYGNNGGNTNYELNNMRGYQNQEEFREEGTNMP